ncbi:MAG: PP2C family protein-serine/threonine phosphatase [bacterium]
MGVGRDVEVDIECFDLSPGDYLLLSSDGVNNLASDEELLRLVSEGSSCQESCRTILEAVNERGGSDNATVVLLKFS